MLRLGLLQLVLGSLVTFIQDTRQHVRFEDSSMKALVKQGGRGRRGGDCELTPGAAFVDPGAVSEARGLPPVLSVTYKETIQLEG